jgi:phosphoribosylformylglycinamidine synthase subunit PurL
MAVSAGIGARLDGISGHTELFNEGPSRFVVATHRPEEVEMRASALGVGVTRLGTAGGDELVIADLVTLAVDQMRTAWSGAIPEALGEPL